MNAVVPALNTAVQTRTQSTGGILVWMEQSWMWHWPDVFGVWETAIRDIEMISLAQRPVVVDWVVDALELIEDKFT